MALDVTMKIDTTAFQKALPAYIAMSKSTTEEILIRRAFFIALRSMSGTPTTGKERILKEMDQEITATRQNGKSGRVKRRYAIVNKMQSRFGQAGLYGDEMRQAASKLVKKRIRSLGAFKAGWLMAITTLGRMFPQGRAYYARLKSRTKLGIDRIFTYYEDRAGAMGECSVMSFSDRISIRLGNNVYFESAKGGEKYNQAVRALQQAINTETAGMIRETERRLQKEYETGRKQAASAVEMLAA